MLVSSWIYSINFFVTVIVAASSDDYKVHYDCSTCYCWSGLYYSRVRTSLVGDYLKLMYRSTLLLLTIYNIHDNNPSVRKCICEKQINSMIIIDIIIVNLTRFGIGPGDEAGLTHFYCSVLHIMAYPGHPYL